MNRHQHLQALVPGYSNRQCLSDQLSSLRSHPATKGIVFSGDPTLPEQMTVLEDAILAAAGIDAKPAAAPMLTGNARAQASIARYLAKIAPPPMKQQEVKTPYGRLQVAIGRSLAKTR